MADTFTDLTALYTPPTIPAPLGESYQPSQSEFASVFSPTNEAMLTALSGVGNPKAPQPQMPFGSTPMFAAQDIANVGGVTGAVPPVDTKAFIPEVLEPTEIQTKEFTEAHEEGGKPLARESKREDRKTDKSERKEEFKTEKAELKRQKKAGEITGRKRRQGRRSARQDKRGSRKAERRVRKQAWKDYKGDVELKAEEAAS